MAVLPMKFIPLAIDKHRTFWIFTIFIILSGCSVTPLKTGKVQDPAFSTIIQAYRKTVEDAERERNWHNGRIGNTIVNLMGAPHLGLCYQWQELVYVGIQPALGKTGWQARGISINKDTYFEHHAVLVYDPKRINPDHVLQTPPETNAYVLDPWESGKPMVYTLADWLKLPLVQQVPARISEVRRFGITGYNNETPDLSSTKH